MKSALAPLQKSLEQMERVLETLSVVRSVTEQLAPLLGQPARVAAPSRAPAPRRREEAPSRAPPKAAAPKARASGARGCAVKGCKRPARSKGYCSAHYQKLRLLIRTGRRPAEWVDDAAPQSVQDVVLPRGRAGARERVVEPETPKEPPKPKAWVRKKGAQSMVSLN